MGFLYNNFISDFFLLLMRWFFSFIGEYSVVIIIVTIIVRMILLPMDIFSRKNTGKMTKIQPDLDELKKRYGNNPQLMQRKQKELFTKAGYKPSAGCLPLLIQLPIFFAFFGAMRVLVSEQTIQLFLNAIESGGTATLPQWLWVNNFWQPDSGLASILPAGQEFISTLTTNSAVVTPQQLSILAQQGLISFSNNTLSYVESVYNPLVTNLISANNLTGYNNGWFILPVLAGATMFLQQWLQKKLGGTPGGDQMKGMMYIFPIVSIWICTTSNCAFALYWTVANVYALAQQSILAAIERRKYTKSRPKPIEEASK